MQDSIFTKIIKGEIPAYKIYEDNKTIAILDIHPKQPGHTLVIPKIQVDQLWDLDSIYYQAVMETCRKVALRIRDVLKPARVGVIVEGVDVNHAHVHLIPFNTPEEFHAFRDMNKATDDKDLAIMEDKLKLMSNK
jgi:histidine triad (HIT) family protein